MAPPSYFFIFQEEKHLSNIGNKIKAGYYKTPISQGDYLKQLLDVKGPGAWLDPTAGEGEALSRLSAGHEYPIETYGVEIDKGRYEIAAASLNHCIHAPIESMMIQNGAYSLVFLNPPYDHTIKGIGDSKSERKEYLELVRNTKYLMEGGLMIFTIPSYRFADRKIARFLATQFENCGVMRFTDEEYDDYKQVVIIATRKRGKRKGLNEKLFEVLLQFENESYIMQHINPINDFIGKKLWTVPVSSPTVKTFYSKRENKGEYYEGLKNSKGLETLKAVTGVKNLVIGGNPILPINQGQLALLLASGAINGLLGEGEDLHLVQGMEIVGKTEDIIESKKDNGAHTKTTKIRTKREVSIKTISPNGEIKKLM